MESVPDKPGQHWQPPLARLVIALAAFVLAAWLAAAVAHVLRADPARPPSIHATGTVNSILAEHLDPVTHPPPAFPFDLSESTPNERRVLDFLARAPIDAQVRMDIALHDLAINADSFGEQGSAYLRENSELKLKVLELLKAPVVDSAQVTAAIEGLRACQDVHQQYLAMDPTLKTGSHAWHKAWMSAYEEWIQVLEAKPTQR